MNAALKTRILAKFEHQWKFAEKVKMDETLISKVLQRGRPLHLKDRKRWARALGCLPTDPIFDLNEGK